MARLSIGLLLLLAAVCRAATTPPGGLSTAQTPQFVLISHDDAITVTTNNAVRQVVNQFTNPNGCNVPVTFFVSGGASSNCNIVQRLRADNHEVATHTLNHSQLVPGVVNISVAIASQRAWLNATCHVPLEEMKGFRSPYLLHNPEVRTALQALGFQWDSSILESWPSATSPSSASRLWPYNMSNGIIQDCQWMAPSTCSSSERYNLWEVPMLQFESANGTALSAMDPTADSEEALLDQLLQQFHYSYDGNRAPFGVYLHTPWFAAKPFHSQALAAFISQVTAPDVFFVTYSQLVEWMQAPVPVSQMASWLDCDPVDFAAEERAPCTVYTVKAGDSLFSICADQEVEVQELLAVNPSVTSTAGIFLGQRLRLPPWNDTCQADGLAGQPPCRNYTVQAGDYLYGVAQQYDLTVNDIVQVNANLTSMSALRISQVLRIPPWPTVECFYGNWTSPAAIPPNITTSTNGSGSPAPAPGPAPSGDATISCGSEQVELDLTLTGFDAAAFQAHLPQFTASLGALLRVPAACITLSRATDVGLTGSGRRRLMAQRSLLSDSQLLAVVVVNTPNATETLGYLQGAQKLGSLSIMVSLLGGQVDQVSATALNAQGTPVSSTPSTAGAPPPSSAPATSSAPSPQPAQPATVDGTAVGSKTTSNVGAIVGGVVGGVAGALLLTGFAWFLIKRRRAATAGTGGLRGMYAISNQAYAGVTAQVSTGAAPAKGGFELTEVVEQTGTPRSARRRTTTPFTNTA